MNNKRLLLPQPLRKWQGFQKLHARYLRQRHNIYFFIVSQLHTSIPSEAGESHLVFHWCHGHAWDLALAEFSPPKCENYTHMRLIWMSPEKIFYDCNDIQTLVIWKIRIVSHVVTWIVSVNVVFLIICTALASETAMTSSWQGTQVSRNWSDPVDFPWPSDRLGSCLQSGEFS